MPITITAQLSAGFPPLVATPPEAALELSLFTALRQLDLRPRSAVDNILDIVGAPGVVVSLTGFRGEPPLEATWRFGKVRIGDRVADDPAGRLLEWPGLSRFLATTGAAGATALEMLMAPPPVGVRLVGGIPPEAAPDERENPCANAPSATSIADWILSSGSNNCYNFAANVLFTRGSPACPGAGGGEPVAPGATCDALTKATGLDRIERADPVPDTCPVGGHYIMVMRRHWQFASDFHCLRLNANRHWTHKDGVTKFPQDTDDQQHPIPSIRNAKFGYDWTFCGFYFVGPARRLSA